MVLAIAVLVPSTVLQLVAAGLALRLVKVTGRRRAWVLLAVALCLMAVRRLVSLVELIGEHGPETHLGSSLVGLAISAVLVVAVGMVGPVFKLAGADAGEARRLADELALSERRLRLVLDAIPEAFLVVVEGRVVFANRILRRVLGREPEEAIGRTISELGGPQLASILAEDLPEQGSSGSWDVTRSSVEISRGGEAAWVDVSMRVGSWDGQIAKICLITDATDRRQGREALAREASLFGAGPVVLFRWRPAPERSVAFVTSNAAQWGFDPETLVDSQESFYERVHPEDRGRVHHEAAEAFKAGRSHWEQEFRLLCPDGEVRWVYDFTVVGRNEDGEVSYFDGYLMDITVRRETQRALVASEERLRLALTATQDVMYDWDIENDAILWNPNTREVLGYAEQEMGSSVAAWAERIHPDDRVRVDAELEEALRGGEAFVSEYRFQRGDGSWAAMVDRGLIIRGADGAAVRMVGAMMDISDRRRLEEQLYLSRRLEAVGSLAGGVAHDFNNLLTAILASADLLQLRLESADEGQEEIHTIKETARRAAQLTHALLAFARRQVLRPVDTDLNAVVAPFLPMLRRVIPESIEIDFIPGRELATVRVDRGQMEQVLMNLTLNARDAMPDGGRLTVETENTVVNGEFVKNHRWAVEGRYVLLTVSDSGRGMDETTLRHAFEPFYTTKRSGKGTGLGLATVYGIVKQHEGMITIYSEPGKGTTVRIYVPSVSRRAMAVGAKIEGPVVGGMERILVVEDEATVRRSTVAMLARLGYAVMEAEDGAEALEILTATTPPPDLILSDVVMPRMGGRELAERVAEVAPGTVFLFSSGYAESAVHDGYVKKSGVHFIAKPYGMDALSRKIRDILDAAKRSP